MILIIALVVLYILSELALRVDQKRHPEIEWW